MMEKLAGEKLPVAARKVGTEVETGAGGPQGLQSVGLAHGPWGS